MGLRILQNTPPWEWPRDTGKRFLSVLGNNQASAEDRLIATQLAGDLVVVNDALCDALLPIVTSATEAEELRAAAAISLGPVLEQADTFGFEDDPDDVPITEQTFRRIQLALQKLYADRIAPKTVRRRILEASLRAPQDWHRDAVTHAWSSGDREWRLTAVFAMQYIRAFDDQILDALKSRDSDIHYEAVVAAGNWSVDRAWDHVLVLVEDPKTPKPLQLAAIEAIGSIRPQAAKKILSDLEDSDDEEIAEAASESLAMMESEDFAEDDENIDGWIQ